MVETASNAIGNSPPHKKHTKQKNIIKKRDELIFASLADQEGFWIGDRIKNGSPREDFK